ncbi:zinc ribbon domain-containing protein [Metabacillus malikii]|uniref:Zinc-ribbon domain-containing protein n=1 Tax=Metabacillus malikii TaxID=1504265 RepID=A0ABT9ZAL0_9BACI|nr:zinc ribbon domain-containing protein [Metabacillus malikii]MDQ0229288.1 hypothetical protein [Metabacillus malikii]
MMYCSNCGAQHEENSKFCASCGTKFNVEVNTTQETINNEPEINIAQQQTAANIETGNNTVVKTRKPLSTLKKSLIVAGIVVIAGVGTAAGMLLHKSPKELYLLSELNSYNQMVENLDSKYGDKLEFQEKALEKPSSSETTISADFEIESLESDPDVQMVKDILSEASLKAKTEMNPLTNEGFYSLGVDLANEEAVNVELFQSKEQLGVKVPVLYEKFLYVNLNEFGEVMRMMDPSYDGPDTLEFSDLQLKDLELTDKEKEHLQKRYTDFLLDHLKDEQFTLQKGVKYEHDGQNLKLDKVTFEMSKSEANQFVIDFIDYVIEDSKLHKMLVDRVGKVVEAAATLEDASLEDFDANDMKKEFIAELKDLKADLKDTKYLSGIKSEILIDKNEQIIDRNVVIGFDEGSSHADLKITSKNVPLEDNDRYKEMKISVVTDEDEDFEVAFEMTNNIEAKKADNVIENLNFSFYVTEYGDSNEISLGVTSNYKGKPGSKQTVNHEFDLKASGDEFYDFPSEISGTIVESKEINLKKEFANEKYDFTFNVEDSYDSGSVMLTVDTKTQLKKKAELPELSNDSSEGINVAKITEDDIYEIQESVYTNMMDLAEKFGLSYEDIWGSSYEDDYYYEEDFFGEDYEDAYFDEESLESY